MGLRGSCSRLFRRSRVGQGRWARAIVREACSRRGVDAADVQVLLRERYFDPGPWQCLSNRRHDLALQLKPRILVRRPKAKLKIQRAIAKTEKVSCGRPLAQYSGI
jgi:hypothetical protein